ncbi:MAG: hypothetical protein AAFY33_19065 [Cyanobacteria bacterium J06643_4]
MTTVVPTHQLSNGMAFRPYAITERSYTKKTKAVPKDLANALANPEQHSAVHPGKGRLYIGQGAVRPDAHQRYPIWLPAHILDSHMLIAGMIGSGKTTVLFRLLAGAVRTYGSVVISEAKAGIAGSAEGAAFTDLAYYLKLKFPTLRLHRWPRGDCWFNPLLYLQSPQDRRTFLSSICGQIESDSHISGDVVAFVHNAASIAEQIIAFMQLQESRTQAPCTLRRLVMYMKDAKAFGVLLQAAIKSEESEEARSQLEEIRAQLLMFNFFYQSKPEFAMTRHGVNLFYRMFDHEDLLSFSEPRDDLANLEIEDILYQKSLVIISQPLYDAASAVVGPLFWDSLLARVIELGPLSAAESVVKPEPEDGDGRRRRQKVLAVLDETHRLPVGRLGESGDFLREYALGLVEITPAIVDEERWMQNKHVYQTLISLSPGVPEVVELMWERLPNYFLKKAYVQMDADTQESLAIRSDYKYQLGEDNPGVSVRSLQMTRRYTGLIQSSALDDERKVFWIDFEDELLANMKQLLQAALMPTCHLDIRRAVDYALGLDEF